LAGRVPRVRGGGRRAAAPRRLMPRELSAGGVAVRRMRGRWWFAAIEPGGRPAVLALPKGLIDRGEQAAATAVRETLEEAGIRCRGERDVAKAALELLDPAAA